MLGAHPFARKEMNLQRPSEATYVLGNQVSELARLDAQAAQIEPATRLLLRAAGIGPGQRVLDLGTGLGHVAHLVADMVGPSGTVVGLDNFSDVLEIARQRASAIGARNMSIVE